MLPGLLPPQQLHLCRTAVHARLGRPGGFTHFFAEEERRGEAGGAPAGLARESGRSAAVGASGTPYRRLPSGHAEVFLAADPSALGGGVGDAEGVGRLARSASQDLTLLGAARHPAVMRAIMQVVGQGRVAAVDGCQVALRFPGCNDALVLSGSAVKVCLELIFLDCLFFHFSSAPAPSQVSTHPSSPLPFLPGHGDWTRLAHGRFATGQDAQL